MPRRKSETLTEAELRLMDVLWQKGAASVQQVLDALTQKPPLAYNSVLTTIRILENKGYVEHVKEGRAHIYRPMVEREQATRSEIRHLVNRFFGNSHELLVLNILEDRGLEAKELKRLRATFASERREMTATALNLQSLAQLSSERILNSTVEGIGIALLAWVLLRALGRQNSGTRFAVWFAALLGIAALPFFYAWNVERGRTDKAVGNHNSQFLGALHICRVVADCVSRSHQSWHWLLALALAAQKLRANRCSSPRSCPVEDIGGIRFAKSGQSLCVGPGESPDCDRLCAAASCHPVVGDAGPFRRGIERDPAA